MKQLGSLKKLSTQTKKLSTQAEKTIGTTSQPLETGEIDLTLQDIETYLVARALDDANFKRELVENPKAVWLREFSDSNLDQIELQVLQEAYDTLYLVIPDSNQKLRRNLIKRPKSVWQQEFSTSQLEGYIIRVVEETPNRLYLVLPYVADDTIDNNGKSRQSPRPWKQGEVPLPLEQSLEFEPTEAEEQDRKRAIAQFVKRYRPDMKRLLPRSRIARLFYYLGIGRLLRRIFRKPLDLIYKFRNLFFSLKRPKI